MPTDSAPATMASDDMSMPAAVIATRAATKMPTYPKPELIAFCPPLSRLVRGRIELFSAPCNSRVST